VKAVLIIGGLIAAYFLVGWLIEKYWDGPRRAARWERLRREAEERDRWYRETPEGRAEKARLIAAIEGERQRNKDAYSEYLRSPWWQHISHVAKEAAQNRCQRCGGSERLEVHHKTYVRRGKEKLEDLEVLCWNCHRLEHRARGY
jgi:5-methylcytosine-specific restriction endonuclease McrA